MLEEQIQGFKRLGQLLGGDGSIFFEFNKPYNSFLGQNFPSKNPTQAILKSRWMQTGRAFSQKLWHVIFCLFFC